MPEPGAQGLLAEARRLEEAGDRAGALDRATRISARDPLYAEAARMAVRLACATGALSVRFEQFVGPFIAKGPADDGDLALFYDLGELYLREEMPENAEEVFGKIVDRAPDYRDVVDKLSQVADGGVRLDDNAADLFAEDERFRRLAARSGPAPTAETMPVDLKATRAIDPSLAAAPGTFAPGTVVADRYRIDGEIGRGGMATVYRAQDLELSEQVALKLFRPVAHDDQGLARFRQELKVSRRLVHANITRFYDIGVYAGHRYISMELLVGHSLEDLSGSPWTLRRGLDTLVQICEGLGYAHSQGVIHRDIKPANLFLTAAGIAKIMDFGIARERERPAAGVTRAGLILGTPEYLSPEQIGGQPASEASDLYALGVVAYEMFAGRKPFEHDQLLPLLQMHVHEEPVPPSRHRAGLTPAVEAVILKLLRKQPSERYPGARALGEALRALREAAAD